MILFIFIKNSFWMFLITLLKNVFSHQAILFNVSLETLKLFYVYSIINTNCCNKINLNLENGHHISRLLCKT
jgi:hypothetical protein